MVKNKSQEQFFGTKNRRGWMRILEVFVALLMIISVLLILMNQGYAGKEDVSLTIYKIEIYILRGIEIDEQFRSEIVNIPDNELPVEWGNFDGEMKNKIEEGIPDYLGCRMKICEVEEICEIDASVANMLLGKDIYVQSVIITANYQKYNPRLLKIFCWVK